MSRGSPQIIVVGAGVIGLATARALLARGAQVTVLEQGRVGRGSASWAAGGILAPLEPGGVGDAVWPLLRRSLRIQEQWYADLLGETGIDSELETPDLEVLAPFDAAAWQALAKQVDIQINVSENQLRPEVSTAKLKLFRVSHVRPPRVLRALAASVRRLGGTLIEEAPVQEVSPNRAEVRVRDEILSADVIVLAAGAWSGQLVPLAQVEPVRGQMLLLKAAPGELGTMKLRNGMYVLQRRDGSVVAGSTLERAGFDDRCTEEAAGEILRAASEMVPWLAERPVLHHWSGLRPKPLGQDLHLGWAQDRRDLYLCTGHHRLGITLAPATAESAAEAILA